MGDRPSGTPSRTHRPYGMRPRFDTTRRLERMFVSCRITPCPSNDPPHVQVVTPTSADGSSWAGNRAGAPPGTPGTAPTGACGAGRCWRSHRACGSRSPPRRCWVWPDRTGSTVPRSGDRRGRAVVSGDPSASFAAGVSPLFRQGTVPRLVGAAARGCAPLSLDAVNGSGPLCVMPAWMRSRGPVAAGGRDARSFDPGQSSACSGLDDSDACQAARFIAAARRRRVKVVVRPAGSACGAGRVSRGRTSRPSVA